jgi:ferredoxin
VNVSPGGTAGSDILLTRIESGDFLAEIITEKGRALSEKYSDLFGPAPKAEKEKYLANVAKMFDVKELVKKIQSGFESEAWMQQSLRCIGCGACAFVCPTCACFDIQDTRKGTRAARKRSWDSCGFSLFTLHASGHNPRTTQDSRWRQRVMHKFAYMPERQNVLGCVGCGRCGRSCSVDMNLKAHLVHLNEALK